MKLHYHPVSPYSRKVLVALLHRGDEFDRHVIDVFQGALGTDAHRAISPFGKMPVLITADGPIFESSSIIEYLECERQVLLTPEVALEARRWDRLGDLYFLDAQTTIWFRKGTEAAEEAAQTAAIALGLLEAQLADGRTFVAGDVFSLGDIATGIGVDYLKRLAVPLSKAVDAYRDRAFAVPAMAEALAEALPTIEQMLARRAGA